MIVYSEGDTSKEGHTVVQASCPVCNAMELDYEAMEISENGNVYYPWKCTNCQVEGQEWYSLEFTGHNIKLK